MPILYKYNNNGTEYDIGAEASNVVFFDSSFIEEYKNDVDLLSAVYRWKTAIVNKQNALNLTLNDLALVRKISNNEEVFSIEDGDGQHYNLNGDGVVTDVISNYLTKTQITNKYLGSSTDYVTLQSLVEYILTNDIDSKIDVQKLTKDENKYDKSQGLDSCKNIYQIINYFYDNIGEPKDRIYNITDYSKYGSTDRKTEPRTNHSIGEDSEPYDVDIVLTSHVEDIMGSSVTSPISANEQTVRIYKKDGAMELGGGSASGQTAVAIGENTFASGKNSFAIGTNVTTSSRDSMIVGRYGAAAANALFTVGNGSNSSNNDIAFSVDSNGNTVSENTLLVMADDLSDDDTTFKAGANAINSSTFGFEIKKDGTFISNGNGTVDGYLNVKANDLEPLGNAYFEVSDLLKVDNNKNVLIKNNLIIGTPSSGDTIVNTNLTEKPGNRLYNNSYAHEFDPAKTLEYNLGTSSLKWKELHVGNIDADSFKDGYFNGRVFADSVFAKHFHSENKGFIKIMTPLERFVIKEGTYTDNGNVVKTWWEGDTCGVNYNSTTGVYKNITGTSSNNEGSSTRAALLANKPGAVAGDPLSTPKVWIDKSSGDIQFEYSGYAPEKIYLRNRLRDSSSNYKDKTRICKFFRNNSFIARAIDRNVAMTCYSGDGEEYNAYIDCWTNSKIVTQNDETVRESWDDFISAYGDVTTDGTGEYKTHFLFFHALYVEALENKKSKEIIDAIKTRRDEALDYVFGSGSSTTDKYAINKIIRGINESSEYLGRGFLKVTGSTGSSSTEIDKGTYLIFFGTCHTSLCYEDLEFISKISKKFNEYTYEGKQGYDFDWLLLNNSNNSYLTLKPLNNVNYSKSNFDSLYNQYVLKEQ